MVRGAGRRQDEWDGHARDVLHARRDSIRGLARSHVTRHSEKGSRSGLACLRVGGYVARSKPVINPVWTEVGAQTAEGRPDNGSNVADEIVQRIEGLIIDGRLVEGERLPSERDLATIFATSRPTISQAIRVLVVRGLIDSRRGSGAYVTVTSELMLVGGTRLLADLNRDSIHQLHQFRLWLETTGVQEAILHGTSAEFSVALNAMNRMKADHLDVAEWMSADTQFHAAIVRASQNPFLAAIYETVHTSLLNFEYQSWIESGRVPSWLAGDNLAEVVELHAPIVDAILDRDATAAIAAVARHHEAMALHLQSSSD